jgi:hypothetical protein
MKYFVAVYTNRIKQYCDERFFRNLGKLTETDFRLSICDNSLGQEYCDRLAQNLPTWFGRAFDIEHLTVPLEPRDTRALRNIAQSANRLRNKFLETDDDYFVIFESDILVPPDTLQLLSVHTDEADIIGGIYYRGFHKDSDFEPDNRSLIPTHHALSGCTLHKRTVIERIPFRWDVKTRGAFPDCFLSFDAIAEGFRVANYCALKCEHLAKSTHPCDRGWGDLE